MTLRDLPGRLLREESRLGALARDLWRWATPNRVRNRIAIVLSAFAAERPEVFFIQIGANDGDHGDPLRRHVLAHDWAGILIEPVPYVFERLLANHGARGKLVLENVAIGSRDGRMPFFHLAQTTEALPHWYDQIGSFLRSNVTKHARYIPNIEERVVETPVQCMTFESLCKKHRVRRIDLLHIDAEGCDFEILKLIDLRHWAPDLLLYEHIHLGAEDYAACRALLGKHGYDLMEESGDTLGLRRGAPGARLARVWRLMKRRDPQNLSVHAVPAEHSL